MPLNPFGIPTRAEIQAAIDEANAAAASAAALLGGKLQRGTFTLTVGTTAVTSTVSFPTAYTSSPTVFCTVIDTAAATTGHRVDRWGTATNDTVGLGDLAGFTFKSTRNSGSAAIRVNWWAIGTP